MVNFYRTQLAQVREELRVRAAGNACKYKKHLRDEENLESLSLGFTILDA